MSDGIERPLDEELHARPARGLIELWFEALDRWIARFVRNMGGVTGRREGRNREAGRGPTLR